MGGSKKVLSVNVGVQTGPGRVGFRGSPWQLLSGGGFDSWVLYNPKWRVLHEVYEIGFWATWCSVAGCNTLQMCSTWFLFAGDLT